MRNDMHQKLRFIDKYSRKQCGIKNKRTHVKNRPQKSRVGPKINTARDTEISFFETDERGIDDEYEDSEE